MQHTCWRWDLQVPLITPSFNRSKIFLQELAVIKARDTPKQFGVICKHKSSWVSDSVWYVIDIDDEKKRSENAALWNTRKNGKWWGAHTIEANIVLAMWQIITKPTPQWSSNANFPKFAQELAMRHRVKSFTKIQVNCTTSTFVLYGISDLGKGQKQLGKAWTVF